MPQDPRVDAYIAKAAPFAQPILGYIRNLVAAAAPELVEDIKWSMPMWLYNGKIVANMAAFKAHAAFGTWRRDAGDAAPRPDGMGRLGKITSLADLPSDAEIAALLHAAMALVDAGGTTTRKAGPKPELAMPDDLQAALDAEPAAAAGFAALPPGARREYLDWVIGAKQSATRQRRIATTVAQTAAGKKLNSKYENC